jgi:enterochelin esterase family protein
MSFHFRLAAFCILTMLAGSAGLVWGQAPEGQPAPSTVRGKQYPRILADRRVIFRVNAPSAKQVAVAGRAADSGMNGNRPYEMEEIEKGVWQVTTDPVRPGFQYYELIIDGLRTNDPASQTFFGWAQPTSGLEVPDEALDFYAEQDVPRGEVRIRPYLSKTTGQFRRAYVYTPPGYDKDTEARYPVLYLQHGSGENETSWTWQGKANLILDNLIAERKAVPMLVVMDQGYGTKPGQEAGAGSRGNEAFEEVVIHDLIPLVDGTYRTRTTRHDRAIAGLSMGAGQAMRIGLGHLDKFATVGSFSGGSGNFDRSASYGGVMADAAAFNSKVDLLWIGCGTEDRLNNGAKALHESLQAAGVEHVWFELPGSHEWQVWRKHLHDFAPRLFRETASR